MTYVELHAHSYYTLLDGASSPAALVARAAALGMPALALTDRDNLIGAVEFGTAATARGIRPIFGAELTLAGGAHLTVLAADTSGYRNLCRLISLAHRDQAKGRAALPFDALAAHHDGLFVLSGCRRGVIAAALLDGRADAAAQAAHRYADLFGRERFCIELQHHRRPRDGWLVRAAAQLARHVGVRAVATGNVHYALKQSHRLHDVLCCIREHTALDRAAGRVLRPNAEFYLKGEDELRPLFRDCPDALSHSAQIAAACDVRLQYGVQSLPVFAAPDGLSAAAYLRQLCEGELPRRFRPPSRRAEAQLAHELSIIEAAHLSNYFLIVWDIVRFAREHAILCQGRGSAANSIVAYLLGISPVDPLAHDLLFERFLSSERQLPPDIDLDFDAMRREEVIQYVYAKYGWEHAAMACTCVTFRARSAVRDVAKALGFPPARADALARAIDGYHPHAHLAHDAQAVYAPSYHDVASSPPPAGGSDRAGGDPRAVPPRAGSDSGEEDAIPSRVGGDLRVAPPAEPLPARLLRELCTEIDGLPRHLGIHNGGMVVMGEPLVESIPVEPATMPDRVVIQWDKYALDDAGLVKIDLLGLRMLSAVADAVAMVAAATGRRPDLDALAYDDPKVYDMICSGDTIGIFQIESRAQQQMIPYMKPRTFNDLVVEISLVRPGPMQGNMVRPYVRRRRGEEPVAYLHPLLEPALKETLGVILFQEQVLKVARDLAGFTPGQGEMLRRAMGRKNPGQEMEKFRADFLAGAAAREVPSDVAEQVFQALLGFGGYAFPKSHAAAFATLVYRSAWLKCYYPAAFYASILNNSPMGFYSPAVVVGDARRHAVPVLPADVNRSMAKCTLESSAIRLGFMYVHGVGEVLGAQIEQARDLRPFRTLEDFCKRARLPRRAVENLIMAGALDGMRKSRRQLVWDLGKIRYDEPLDLHFPDDDVRLPPLTVVERVLAEYSLLGVATGAHPMALYDRWLRRHGVLTAQGLERRAGAASHHVGGGPGESGVASPGNNAGSDLYDASPHPSVVGAGSPRPSQPRASTTGMRVRVAGLVAIKQAPPTAKGFVFVTLDAGDGLINVIANPQVYERYRPAFRYPLIVVEGDIQNEVGVVNVLAVAAAPMPARPRAPEVLRG